jgi:hypothetical protein
MPKVPHAAEHHGHAALVGCVNHFLVAHGAAGLDHIRSSDNNQLYPGQKRSLAAGVAALREVAQIDAGVHQEDQAMYWDRAQFQEVNGIERRHWHPRKYDVAVHHHHNNDRNFFVKLKKEES